MKIGDIINTKGKGVIGRIISAFIKSPYTHTLCYIGEGQCVESYWGGVQLKHFRDVTKREFDIFRHKTATETQLLSATRWMLTQIGHGYDYKGLIGIGLAIIGKKKINKLDEKDRYWCSELVADGYNKVGIKCDFNPNTWLTSPADFVRNKYFRRIT